MDMMSGQTVRVGDVVLRRPVTVNPAEAHTNACREQRGKVVYVHPLERYHIVEFGEAERRFRESFPGVAT